MVNRAFLRTIKKLDEESYGGGGANLTIFLSKLSLILFVFFNSADPVRTHITGKRQNM